MQVWRSLRSKFVQNWLDCLIQNESLRWANAYCILAILNKLPEKPRPASEQDTIHIRHRDRTDRNYKTKAGMSMFLITSVTTNKEGQQPLDTTDKVTHKPNRLFSLYSALYPAFEMTIARVTQCRDFRSATHPGTIPICTLKPDATLRAQTRRLITSILQQQSNDTMRWNVMRCKISDSRSIVCVRPQILESSASP